MAVPIMPFLKGTHVAVEVLQHPFFAKVEAENSEHSKDYVAITILGAFSFF